MNDRSTIDEICKRFGDTRGWVAVVHGSKRDAAGSLRVIELRSETLSSSAVPSGFPDNVDGIYLRRILEKARDPGKLLCELVKRVKDGGLLLLETSGESSEGDDLFRFTDLGLRHLAAEAGCAFDTVAESPPGSQILLLRRPPTVVSSPVRGRAVFLNTYYTGFLEAFYRRQPELLSAPYDRQLSALVASAFGDSDFYSDGMLAAGWEGINLIVNATPLQQAWAREHGCVEQGWTLVAEQLRQLRPDVLYIQDTHVVDAEVLSLLRPWCRLIVGQVASSPKSSTPYGAFDFVVSSLPGLVRHFRSEGVTAYYQPLAFDPRVLGSIPSHRYEERPIGCSFVGSVRSECHSARYAFLEEMAKALPLRVWGHGGESLPADSALRARWEGEAWGLEMFERLATSKITLNIHAETLVTDRTTGNRVDAGGLWANNMRLFEATACGALLVTEYRDNLNELFEIGKEVVAYRSTEECIALVKYYTEHPDEAAAIAEAGQRRTLEHHTYRRRMWHTVELVERHLRYNDPSSRGGTVDFARISYGHRSIGRSEVRSEHTEAWKDESIPSKQRVLVQSELSRMYRGDVPLPFEALAMMTKPVVYPGTKVLELGCASGYYYEILEYLLSQRIEYWGVDYSAAMVEMGRNFYPRANFVVADGADLPFGDAEFPLVVSSGVLLHVPNYREHLIESIRVASDAVILHRTPVSLQRPTSYESKFAYGVETVELTFNEAELLDLCASLGLRLEAGVEIEADPGKDYRQRSYRFRRGPV